MAMFSHESVPGVTVMTLPFWPWPSVSPRQAPAQHNLTLIPSFKMFVTGGPSIPKCPPSVLRPPPLPSPTGVILTPPSVPLQEVGWLGSHWRHVGAKKPQPHPISRSFLTASFQDRRLFDCSIAESRIPDQTSRPCPCDHSQQHCPLRSVRFQTLQSFFRH